MRNEKEDNESGKEVTKFNPSWIKDDGGKKRVMVAVKPMVVIVVGG